MSLHISSHQKDYLKILKKTMRLRNEISDLSSQLIVCEEEKKDDLDTISELEKDLSRLQSRMNQKSALMSRVDFLDISTSLTLGNSTNQSSYTCSSPLSKKAVSKECEVTDYTENIIEEFHDDELYFFEQFLVLGDSENINNITKMYPENILYCYPVQTRIDNDIVNIIKSIAFPQGISPVALRLDKSILSQVEEVLFRSYYRNGNSFIFTVPAQVESKPFGFSEMSNNSKSILYCCCLMFEELDTSAINKSLCIVPRCYCILTYFPCFELHFEVLYRMLDLKRAHRSSTLAESEDILHLLQHKSLLNVTEEEIGLLESYFDYFMESTFEKTMPVCITLQTVENIDYVFPADYSNLDKIWFCPLLFSLMTTEDFYYILCAMLQEKKIVFHSTNLDFLSCSILGFQSLLAPFQWQNTIIPIFIEEFEERLRDCTCYIIGVTGEVPSVIKHESFIYFNLDTGELNKHTNRRASKYYEIHIPYSYNLFQEISADFESFQNEYCYLLNESLSVAARNIIDATKNFISWVIDEMFTYCNTKNILDFEIYREIIKNHAGRDKHFFSSILNTEMFMHLYTK